MAIAVSIFLLGVVIFYVGVQINNRVGELAYETRQLTLLIAKLNGLEEDV